MLPPFGAFDHLMMNEKAEELRMRTCDNKVVYVQTNRCDAEHNCGSISVNVPVLRQHNKPFQ